MLDRTLTDLRSITSTKTLRPYDRYGIEVPGLEWLPLSGGSGEAHECFLVRFKPGAASKPHEHGGTEEFMVLEGELEDSDGTIMRAGDFVSYRPGSRHFSVSESGCLLLVLLTGSGNRLLDDQEAKALDAHYDGP